MANQVSAAPSTEPPALAMPEGHPRMVPVCLDARMAGAVALPEIIDISDRTPPRSGLATAEVLLLSDEPSNELMAPKADAAGEGQAVNEADPSASTPVPTPVGTSLWR